MSPTQSRKYGTSKAEARRVIFVMGDAAIKNLRIEGLKIVSCEALALRDNGAGVASPVSEPDREGSNQPKVGDIASKPKLARDTE